MFVTPKEMKKIGKIHSQSKIHLSDKELKLQIEALDLVIAYLQGRRDCSLVVFPLILNMEMYKGFMAARKGE